MPITDCKIPDHLPKPDNAEQALAHGLHNQIKQLYSLSLLPYGERQKAVASHLQVIEGTIKRWKKLHFAE